ncbi:hypothetical protein XELAEV_18045143mg [Xenopus laevis]|uniref:Uncharacterized protein n=1 Tax=Xenopus laevis TaxID=8355 RepID=A0A974C0E6_XENLA|nr:hypothetical protein XELAEV_18045143mg [Xenopus laevis]
MVIDTFIISHAMNCNAHVTFHIIFKNTVFIIFLEHQHIAQHCVQRLKSLKVHTHTHNGTLIYLKKCATQSDLLHIAAALTGIAFVTTLVELEQIQ